MKYLEHLGLENISNVISSTHVGGGVSLHGRVEIYSTKKSVDDKRHSKLLESKLASGAPLPMGGCAEQIPDTSPDKYSQEVGTKKTRKMLVNLIQTLNAAQLDHDFSELSQESFVNISIQDAMSQINGYLSEVCVKQPSFPNSLWKEIDDALSYTLSDCEVYKLTDESCCDDLDEGITSSFHYFFCNNDLKRLCYFHCHTTCSYRKYNHAPFGTVEEDDMDIGDENLLTGWQETQEDDKSFDWH